MPARTGSRIGLTRDAQAPALDLVDHGEAIALADHDFRLGVLVVARDREAVGCRAYEFILRGGQRDRTTTLPVAALADEGEEQPGSGARGLNPLVLGAKACFVAGFPLAPRHHGARSIRANAGLWQHPHVPGWFPNAVWNPTTMHLNDRRRPYRLKPACRADRSVGANGQGAGAVHRP